MHGEYIHPKQRYYGEKSHVEMCPPVWERVNSDVVGVGVEDGEKLLLCENMGRWNKEYQYRYGQIYYIIKHHPSTVRGRNNRR